jgi:hypothetical protein
MSKNSITVISRMWFLVSVFWYIMPCGLLAMYNAYRFWGFDPWTFKRFSEISHTSQVS